MRWLLCAVLWVAANVVALLAAAQTRFGPIVLTLSPRHGVHLGDVLAVVVGLAVASTLTLVIWLTAPERPPIAVAVAWVVAALAWEACLVVSLFVPAATDVGPVVVRVGRHHVHLGDIAVVVGAVVVAVVVAAVATAVTVTSTRTRRASAS